MGVDLGDLDPYDEYFEGLTGGERREEMKPNARASPPKQQEEGAGPGWFRQTIGFILIIGGTVIELAGMAYMWLGQFIQKGGRKMSGSLQSSNHFTKDSP